jgi:hypothetical protein
VKRFRKSEYRDVEAELKKNRPQPRSDFLSALADRVESRAPGHARGRLALAGALSVAMLATFALLGGIGYAASAVSAVAQVTKVARIVGVTHSAKAPASIFAARSTGARPSSQHDEHGDNHHGGGGDNDGDDDEYKGGKGCGDKNHVHSEHNKCKDGDHDHGDHGGHENDNDND